MEVIEHPDLVAWREIHGTPMQIGLMVMTTDKCEYTDFRGGKFMVTSLSIDQKGLNIGINDDGKPDDFSTGYDEFRIDELQPVTD